MQRRSSLTSRTTGFTLVVTVAAGLLVGGCAGNREFVRGKQTVVEASSSSKPDWAYKTSYFKKDGMLCFSGGVTDAHDYALARRQAKAAAMKNAVESISVLAKTEYTEALRGTSADQDGRFVQDAIAFTADSVNLEGLLPGEEYMEKIETQTDDGVRYGYNLFGYYQLKESDYTSAKHRALDKMLGKAREANDKAAEQTALTLLDKLNSGETK